MALTKEEHARELKIKEFREDFWADESIFEMSDEQCISCGDWLSNEEKNSGTERCIPCFKVDMDK